MLLILTSTQRHDHKYFVHSRTVKIWTSAKIAEFKRGTAEPAEITASRKREPVTFCHTIFQKSTTMARSNARAGPSQPSQTQRTRASRGRIEEVVLPDEQEEEEINDNEDEDEEVAMDVDDESDSVRIVV